MPVGVGDDTETWAVAECRFLPFCWRPGRLSQLPSHASARESPHLTQTMPVLHEPKQLDILTAGLTAGRTGASSIDFALPYAGQAH